MSLFSLYICMYKQKGVFKRAEYIKTAVTHAHALLLSFAGSDIVQWMIKNLDIEDQGKNSRSGVQSGQN